MSFQTNKYQVIKQAIPHELANFVFNYFLLKRDAVNYMYSNNIIAENYLFGYLFGTWKEDQQVPNVYSHYADFAMETLLMKVIPVIKEKTNLDLIPTYSYARLYEKGSILKRHKDRPSCEISTTLNLGGDPWAIYLDTTGSNNVIDEDKNIIKPDAPKGIRVDLEAGDMLVYAGCELEHWREEFTGNICSQVFLHYNNVNGHFEDLNLYDNRPLLGIPPLR
jgi:hypothetical protein